MFCTQCGSLTPGGASRCPSCGHAPPPPAPGAATGGEAAWGSVQVGLGVAALVLAALAVGLGTLWLVDRSNAALVALATSLALGLAILPIAGMLGPRRLGGMLPALGFKSPRQAWPVAMVMAAGALAASLAFTVLYATAVEWAGWPVLEPPEVPGDIVFPGAAAVITFLALAVWTPITEELFFRGFVMGGLTARWGGGVSAVVSALIFSLFHLSPRSVGVVLPVFATGLLLAWLYRRTGSLWPCAAAHAGQNAIVLAETIYRGLDKAA